MEGNAVYFATSWGTSVPYRIYAMLSVFSTAAAVVCPVNFSTLSIEEDHLKGDPHRSVDSAHAHIHFPLKTLLICFPLFRFRHVFVSDVTTSSLFFKSQRIALRLQGLISVLIKDRRWRRDDFERLRSSFPFFGASVASHLGLVP